MIRTTVWLRWVSFALLMAGCSPELETDLTTLPTAGVGGQGSEEVWSPGDPIPGWEDFDCGELAEGAGSVSIHLPDLSSAHMLLYPNYKRRALSFALADCGSISCHGDQDWPALGVPYAEVGIRDDDGGATSRGQGWYGPEAISSYEQTAGFAVRLINGEMENSEERADQIDGRVCLSRVRPDMIEGVVRIVKVTGVPYESVWYTPVVILLPFTIPFVDHSSLDYALDTDPDLYPPPAGAEEVWYHLVDYDQSWPWDEITDPAIKDAVYARYTPWNWP